VVDSSPLAGPGAGTPFSFAIRPVPSGVAVFFVVTAVSGGATGIGIRSNVVTCGIAPPQPKIFVALGDSYTSGDGAPPYFNGPLRISSDSYPVFLAGHPDLNLLSPLNLACTGYTSQQVNDIQVQLLRDSNSTRQVDDIVITVGGDNVGFASILS